MYDKRDVIGKIFFGAAILILLYMFICPISNVMIHVDEYWTYALVNLPFLKGMTVAIHDVHPPLHYLILYLFSPLGLSNLYLLKMVSVIPYILLILVSYFKVKKDYNWLTAGLFIFCIGVMSDFFVEYLTIRMYSWGLFFVVMAFIYFKDVISKWDRKSWILLTLFTLLSAYTQYFFAITCGLIYLMVLFKILKSSDVKARIKQFAFSLISLAVLYAPWMVVLVHQLQTHPAASYEIPKSASYFNYLTFFAINSNDLNLEMIIFKVLALIFLFLVLFLIYKHKAKYEASGVLLMYATIAIGIVILMVSAREIHVRYLIPVIGIFWLSASIIIGKIENSKVLAVMLVLVIVFAGISIYLTQDDIADRFEFNDKKSKFLDSINNNNSIIAYDTDFGYQVLHDDLNKTKQYSLSDTYFYDTDTEVCKDLNKIIKKNPDKDIYLVLWEKLDKYKKYDLDEKFKSGYSVYLVET